MFCSLIHFKGDPNAVEQCEQQQRHHIPEKHLHHTEPIGFGPQRSHRCLLQPPAGKLRFIRKVVHTPLVDHDTLLQKHQSRIGTVDPSS